MTLTHRHKVALTIAALALATPLLLGLVATAISVAIGVAVGALAAPTARGAQSDITIQPVP